MDDGALRGGGRARRQVPARVSPQRALRWRTRSTEFEALPDEWDYPGPAARDSLLAFNRQCGAGDPKPSRRLDSAPLVNPPYYVIEVIPAITFTFSGLRIDQQARVLDESAEVIPGLLAAGADAGGVLNRAYAGGLACALVFGLQAAATATAARAAA